MNTNHENHKLLWNELARTGSNYKYEVVDMLGLPQAKNHCFACESVVEYDQMNCEECPINWAKGIDRCSICDCNPMSPFYRWESALTPRTRKRYALIIANMEWKEGGHHER